jgi:HPr kinase/phosphorylase
MTNLSKILSLENVQLDLEVSSKKRAFEQAGLIFENNCGIARSTVSDNLFARERLGSTGLGHGVAVPHGRIKGSKSLKSPLAAFVRLVEPIPFESPDGQPVKLLFFLLIPDHVTQHTWRSCPRSPNCFRTKPCAPRWPPIRIRNRSTNASSTGNPACRRWADFTADMPMLQTPLTIQRLYDDNRDTLQLGWFAGFPGGERLISGDAVSAADQVGHLNLIHPGPHPGVRAPGTELLPAPEIGLAQPRDRRTDRGRAAGADHRAGPRYAARHPRHLRREEHPAVFHAPAGRQVIDFLRVYLSKKLAQRVIMHGVFMDVLGVGVLITGDSGLGKSELGLELISRSHGLVADDAVEFSRIAPNMIEGRCPPLLQNLLEVRGLGLLDIKAIFGETAVRRKMRLKLIVHLVKRGALDEEVERLPFHFPTEDVLGLPIRKVVIPVAAGRNIAVLLEAAVRNTILQLRGIDTLQEFMERQRQAMSSD